MRAVIAAVIAACAFGYSEVASAEEAPAWLVGEYTGQVNSKLVGTITDVIQIKSVTTGADGRLIVDAVYRSDRDPGGWRPTQTQATVVAPDLVKLVVVVPPPANPGGRFNLDAKSDGSLTGMVNNTTGPTGASIRFKKNN